MVELLLSHSAFMDVVSAWVLFILEINQTVGPTGLQAHVQVITTPLALITLPCTVAPSMHGNTCVLNPAHVLIIRLLAQLACHELCGGSLRQSLQLALEMMVRYSSSLVFIL